MEQEIYEDENVLNVVNSAVRYFLVNADFFCDILKEVEVI